MEPFIWTLPPHREPDLTIEYRRLYYVTTMVDSLTAILRTHEISYPVHKILEDWLIDLANEPGTDDPVFRHRGPYPLLRQAFTNKIPQISSSLVDELMNTVTTAVSAFFTSITPAASSSATASSSPALPLEPVFPLVRYDGEYLYLGSDLTWKFDFPASIYQRLLLAHHQISPERGRERTADLLKVFLRYQSILPYGDQWAVPRSFYSALEEFGFTYEAFASPFNSNFLQLAVNNGTPFSFGSVFLDTDQYFGSQGSFFALSHPLPSLRLVVNAVFTPTLLHRTITKMEELLSGGPVTIQFNGPGTLESYPALRDSPFLRGSVVIPPRQMIYYFKDVPRVSKFPSLFVFLSSDPAFSAGDATALGEIFLGLTSATPLPSSLGQSIVI